MRFVLDTDRRDPQAGSASKALQLRFRLEGDLSFARVCEANGDWPLAGPQLQAALQTQGRGFLCLVEVVLREERVLAEERVKARRGLDAGRGEVRGGGGGGGGTWAGAEEEKRPNVFRPVGNEGRRGEPGRAALRTPADAELTSWLEENDLHNVWDGGEQPVQPATPACASGGPHYYPAAPAVIDLTLRASHATISSSYFGTGDGAAGEVASGAPALIAPVVSGAAMKAGAIAIAIAHNPPVVGVAAANTQELPENLIDLL